MKLEQLSDSNVYDPKIIECPWAFDALLRQRAPVSFDEANNIYLVSTYELISYVVAWSYAFRHPHYDQVDCIAPR